MANRDQKRELTAAKLRASRFRYELVRDYGEDIAERAIQSIGEVGARRKQEFARLMVAVEFLQMKPRNVNELARRLVARGESPTFDAAKAYIRDARRRYIDGARHQGEDS